MSDANSIGAPVPDDTTCVTEFVYRLHDPDGSVRVQREQHVEGLFRARPDS